MVVTASAAERSDLSIALIAPFRWSYLAAVIGLFWLGTATPSQAAADENFFESKIRPLLAEHCWKCHGELKQWGDLRLDSRAALLRGGEHGPVVEPGHPEKSSLIKAIRRQGDVQMPPDEKLTEQQIADVEQWIQQNAVWPAETTKRLRRPEDHWAFRPVVVVEPPAVADPVWNQNPIDRFVRSRLTREKLFPSADADRRTLIRRVTYDLTGLPPAAADVEAFVRNDDSSADSQLIERLLDSPQYGEQWARHWLDVARYSDTKGYVYAREERVWVHAPSYRDWVVKAFQQDLPYDRFLMLQIAADQVAPDDHEAAAAMGFLTLGRRFLGVTPDIMDDRIDVVTRGTMGMTVACARCHDHKYDPIPTSDYYSLYSIFLNSRETLVSMDNPNTGDQAFDQEFAKRLTQLRETTALKHREASDRVRDKITDYLVAQTDLSSVIPEGFDVILAKDDVIPHFVRYWDAYLSSPDRLHDPIFMPWVRLVKVGADRWDQDAALVLKELESADINPRIRKALAPLPASFRELTQRYGQVFAAVNQEWKARCASETPIPQGLADPADEQIRQFLFSPRSPCAVPDELIISTEEYFDSGTCNELWKLQGEVDRWLINSPQSPRYAVKLVDRAWMRPSFVFRRGNPKSKGDFVAPHFLSLLAGDNPQSFTEGSGRLELARAIVDPKNPLTARVWVNRIWQHHFGEGLVSTPSDFGVRAEPPSHPELLDWLAAELIRHGWSTKAIHRLILTSQTYRQNAAGSTDPAVRSLAMQKDPSNRLLWKMNSHRLTFEEMRDSLLSVSGRLDPKPGGRARDLFSGQGMDNRRRTIYGTIDRQFLASSLRIFDFANPDLHIPRRSDTIVPQQALFSLNHPLMAGIAQSVVARIEAEHPHGDAAQFAQQLYRTIYQREPTTPQVQLAVQFLSEQSVDPPTKQRPETLAWSYGWGQLDDATKSLKKFSALPYFTGKAWQGAAEWPGGGLGWLQLTADGGHTGNDLEHSVVRRWTAPRDGHYAIESQAIHEEAAGDGVRCYIVSSRGGLLASASIHNRSESMNVADLELKTGDTVDFVVDVNAVLNCDQHLWAPRIREQTSSDTAASAEPHLWDARADFAGPWEPKLTPRQQLAQVLLMSNEFLFVD